MKDFNLDFLQKEVGTKYNDMVGLAALDGHSSTVELQDLCKQQGVDLDKYDLVGLEFLDGERRRIRCRNDKDIQETFLHNLQ